MDSNKQGSNSDGTDSAKKTSGQAQSTDTNSPMRKNLGQLKMFTPKDCQESTSSLSDGLARICQLLASGEVSKHHEAAYSLKQCESSGMRNPTILSLKTSKVFSQVTMEKTLSSYCERLPTLGMMCNGNFLILGGFSPKIENGFTLSDILQENVDPKYFLSEKQTRYIAESGGGRGSLTEKHRWDVIRCQ